jgi:hypothetical protein
VERILVLYDWKIHCLDVGEVADFTTPERRLVMSVKYRVVHTRNLWRKVGNHKSVKTAIDGPDGANALLLKRGRLAQKWFEHGDPLCVFVWDDNQENGHVFRLQPGTTDKVQSVVIPIDAILKHEQEKACSESDLSHYFEPQ